MIKGAIIGFAGRGKALAGAAAEAGLKITAVCEQDKTRAAEAAAELPGAAVYRSAGDLFSRCGGLAFAVINVPPADRARASLRALENRLGAACVAPVCFSVTDFEKLRAAADAAGRPLFPLQPWERGRAWQAVMKALDGGLPGDLRCVSVKLFSKGPAPEGGVTAALGWQAFSMLLALARRPPSALSARLSPAPDSGAPDSTAAFQVHFPGLDGSVNLACGCRRDAAVIEAEGENGSLRLEGGALSLDIEGHAPETVDFRRGPDGLPPPAGWLAAEFAALAAALKDETAAGAGLRNSRYCVRLLKNALYSASLNSAAVPL